MFKSVMDYIKNFLDNTPDDIYEFSAELEGKLAADYDTMYKEQPLATEILADEIPDICASAEPGMTQEEIAVFIQRLKKEYDKAMKEMIL